MNITTAKSRVMFHKFGEVDGSVERYPLCSTKSPAFSKLGEILASHRLHHPSSAIS